MYITGRAEAELKTREVYTYTDWPPALFSPGPQRLPIFFSSSEQR